MSTTTAPRPLLDELRDFARSNIVPVNATIGLSAVLVCVLDFCAPLIGATGFQLIAAVVAALALWLLWTGKKRLPGADAIWRLAVAFLLIFFAIGTAAASTKASQGGFFASSSDKARAVQAVLFDIRKDVGEIRVGVVQANEKLDRLAELGNDCTDFNCAIYESALLAKVQEFASRGLEVPTLGVVLIQPMLGRSPNRFEVMKFLLEKGPGINEPFIELYIARAIHPGAVNVFKSYAGGADISKAEIELQGCMSEVRFRWLEVAIVANDKEMVKWLIDQGADPKLKTTWCKGGAKTFSASQWMSS